MRKIKVDTCGSGKITITYSDDGKVVFISCVEKVSVFDQITLKNLIKSLNKVKNEIAKNKESQT